jgi:hypothetical protein
MELVARMVATVIPVASIDPELIAVATTLLIVASGAYTLAELTLVLTRMLEAVMLVAKRSVTAKFPADKLVETMLEIVAFVALICPELTLVEARSVEVVMLLLTRISPVTSSV